MSTPAVEATETSPAIQPNITIPNSVPAFQAPPAAPAATPTSRTWSDEDLERVRREEKDKLYPTLEELRNRLKVHDDERDARLAAEQAAVQAAEDASRQQREEAETLAEKFARSTEEIRNELERERSAREMLAATLQKEREWSALQDYKQAAIQANADNIIPELLTYISGDTPQEIDASVADLVERTQSIIGNTTAALSAAQRNLPGTRVTAPPIGALEVQQAVHGVPTDAQSIHEIPLSKWGEVRGNYGVGNSGNNRGLFD